MSCMHRVGWEINFTFPELRVAQLLRLNDLRIRTLTCVKNITSRIDLLATHRLASSTSAEAGDIYYVSTLTPGILGFTNLKFIRWC